MLDRTTVSALTLAIVTLAAGCARLPTDEPAAGTDLSVEVAAIADGLWELVLDRELQLRLMNGLPIEELPQLSLEEEEATAAAAADLLERLDRLDLAALDHEDSLTARVVRFDLEHLASAPAFYWNTLSLSPYQSLYTWRMVGTVLATFELSGPEEVARYRKLLGDYVRLLEQHLAKARGQAERGIRLPRAAIPGTIAMLEGFRDQFAARRELAPERLAALDGELRSELQAEVDRRTDEVVAGYDAIIDLLSGDYRELAPEAVGASQFPGGKEYYRRQARYYTTLDLAPEEIHQLGLEGVRELEEEMARIREEVGFEGTREQFHDLLRTDPRFLAADASEVEARYTEAIARVEERIGELFAVMPKAPYGVRRLTPAEEVNSTYGYYRPPDSIDPTGTYNYNGSRLDERSQVGARSLILHELLPGHHFQVALQLENESLHPYCRNAYFGAFTEGWAEYAAGLGEEMGVYADPYDRYGRRIMELFLATRLVVDTGIGAFGWSLEEARAYMREHVFQSDREIETETLRYATRPGQALGYRLGHDKIWELRRRAERELGDAFDLPAFHAAVLGSGNLPLGVLEEHVDWWIDGSRSAGSD